MEETRRKLKDLKEKFQSKDEIVMLNQKCLNNHNEKEFLEKSIKDISYEITSLERMVEKLETEIQKYNSIKIKNSNLYSKYNKTRLKLNKELVEDEINLEKLEQRIYCISKSVEDGKNSLENMKYFLKDKIFLELVKGFGIENEMSNGVMVYKIVNKEKDEVFVVDATDKDRAQKIWDFID